jgi:hypothetical protein
MTSGVPSHPWGETLEVSRIVQFSSGRCLSRQHIAGGARMNRRILGSPISAKRDVGRVICLTVTTALGETLHGSKSMTVQCDTARRGMLRVRFTENSHIPLMSQVAASPIAERAHET